MKTAARLLTLGLLLAMAMPARGQIADHLQCFKIKDALAKTTYIADVIPSDLGLVAAEGCTVKVPAKLLCVGAQQTNVVGEPPPGSMVGPAAAPFLCYKAKCPQSTPTATVVDQFGTHEIAVKATSLLCAPVAPTSMTSSTSTTVPSTTSTSVTSTTSTLLMCVPSLGTFDLAGPFADVNACVGALVAAAETQCCSGSLNPSSGFEYDSDPPLCRGHCQ